MSTRSATVPDHRHLELSEGQSNAIVVYRDVRCPWAHVGLHGLLRAIEARGLTGEVSVDLRAFPLELLDDAPDPAQLARAAGVLATIAPDAGWASGTRRRPVPSSSTAALELVEATKACSVPTSVAVDEAIRRAVFIDRADIGDPDVLHRVAGTVEGFDEAAVRAELDSGRARAEIDQHLDQVRTHLVEVSPTVVLPDGSAFENPGIEHHESGGDVVVDAVDLSAHEGIVDHFLAQRTYD